MQKLLAFILILLHVNSSMFLPQVAEDDVYDANGNQLDDINTVIEYFQVAMGYDHTADDEDDDTGQNFHLIKNIGYNFQQVILTVKHTEICTVVSQTFYETNELDFQSLYLEILTPPPKFKSA